MLNKLINTTIVSFIFCFYANPVIASTTTILNGLANVQVSGAVKKPGIYKIPTGTRLVDVIYKAGGLRKDAILSDVNMTTPVTDGTSIYISSKTDTEEIKKTEIKKDETKSLEKNIKSESVSSKKRQSKEYKKLSSNQVKNDGLLNLNSATEEDLNNLPGIGETLAKNIISYRNKNGRFRTLSDLDKVEGIGKKKFKKLKNKVTI